jgi:hypothetical protein
MIASLTAGGIGLLLAGIVAILIWKDHGKRPPGRLALLAGMFSSGTVLSWLGGLVAYSIVGVAVTTVVLVLGGIVFYIEVIKNHKPHKWRTPLVAFAVGIALTASFGGVQHAVNQGTVHLTSVISRTTNGGR